MNKKGGRTMRKLIALVFSGIMLFLSCAHQENLTEEGKEKYRRAKHRYEAGQRGGP
jgi:hypothetical protein